MRLLSTRIRGLGTFRGEVSLDLEGLDARIVAVRGENGAGKSTLLELAIPGALYRSTPTRGALKDLALARDALLESVVESSEGRRYTIRHLVDGVNGKGESVVLDESGSALVSSAKVSEYDAWAEQHLPSPDVLFASLFCAQQAGGFLSAKPAERKSLLLQILGIQRYEELARGASEQARGAASQIEVLRGRLAETRSAKDCGEAEDELAQSQRTAADAAKMLEAAQESLRLHEEARADEERAVAAQREIATRREQLTQQLRQTRAELDAIAVRRSNNLGLVDRAVEIRDAAEQLHGAREHLQRTQSEVTRLEGAHSGHLAAKRASSATRAAAAERVTRLRQQVQSCERVLAGAAEIDEASSKQPDAVRRLAEAEASLAAALEELRHVQGQQLAGASERISMLRSGLEGIRSLTDDEMGEQGQAIAVLTLEADDSALEAAEHYPAKKREAEEAYKAADAARIRVDQELRQLERILAREGELVSAREQLSDAAAQMERETLAEADATAAEAASDGAAMVVLSESITARERLSSLERQIAKLEGAARLLPNLDQATARIEELDAQSASLSATATALAAQVAGLVVHDVPEPRDLGPARADVDAAQRAVANAGASLALAERALADALGAEQRQAELRSELAGAETELSDWTRLADDLGKKGLQAAVIDGALPELVTITNDLLHAAFGPRFTIDVRTQAINSTGKKLIETLDVVVIDTEAGREAPAETYSGGERVILSEALALALTTLACREHGIRSPTLVRDESGAALSATRAPQWIAMLRRAADLIGAGHVLFVSHDPAVWELADASIVVAGGRVTAER